MQLLKRIWQSSLGKKYVMAATGSVMVLFIVVHMLGNLQIYIGPDHLNAYANFLQHTPGIVWTTRLSMLTAVTLHIAAAITLTIQNRRARPQAYSRKEVVAASYASRTMMISGFLMASFVIYHLLHFTVEVPTLNFTPYRFSDLYHPPGDPRGTHDVYLMMLVGFRQPIVSGFYIFSMALLCFHLQHGIRALGQSLGVKTEASARLVDRLALALAWIIFLGNSSIPVAVLCGLGKNVVRTL